MNYNTSPQQPSVAPYYLTEEYKETQSIKKTSNFLGLGVILSLVFSTFISIILVAIVKIFAIDLSDNNAFMGLDPVIYYVITSITAMVASILPFYISSSLMKNKISDLIQFKPFDKKLGHACISIGLMACVYANFAANSLVSNLNSIGIYPHVPEFQYDNNIVSIIMYIISIAIIPPLVEEFAYRGVILGSLRQYGDGFAILVSSTLFGLMHANFGQIPFAFIVGLVSGFLTVRFNSILPAIIIHFINNLLAAISEVINQNLGDHYEKIFLNLSFLVLVLSGIFCLIYILKKDKSFFSIQRPTSVLNLKQKIKSFASGAVMIIALALIAFETLAVSVS